MFLARILGQKRTFFDRFRALIHATRVPCKAPRCSMFPCAEESRAVDRPLDCSGSETKMFSLPHVGRILSRTIACWRVGAGVIVVITDPARLPNRRHCRSAAAACSSTDLMLREPGHCCYGPSPTGGVSYQLICNIDTHMETRHKFGRF